MMGTVVKIATSSVASCLLCATALLSSTAMIQANAQEEAPAAVIEAVAPASSESDAVPAQGNDAIVSVPDAAVEIPSPAEEVIEGESVPLAAVEEVAPAPTQEAAALDVLDPALQCLAFPEPQPTQPAPAPQSAQPVQSAQPAVSSAVSIQDLIIDAAYMVDGEKMYYRGELGGMYTFESEEVAGDGWSLGTAELIMSAEELAKMEIVRL